MRLWGGGSGAQGGVGSGQVTALRQIYCPADVGCRESGVEIRLETPNSPEPAERRAGPFIVVNARAGCDSRGPSRQRGLPGSRLVMCRRPARRGLRGHGHRVRRSKGLYSYRSS